GRKALLDSLTKAPKQQDAVMAYLQLSRQQPDVPKIDIMETSGCSSAIISALVEKEVFVAEERAVSRLAGEDVEVTGDFTFSNSQQAAFDNVNRQFAEKD